MLDKLGRKNEYLRLSVTERCSLRCAYCRRDEGYCPKAAELTAGEFTRIVKACAQLGINKVRLTGGEPLLRKDIIDIVNNIAQIEGINELSMTTNAQQMGGKALALKEAGLDRINISLDSLDPGRFKEMTGGDLTLVLEGIHEAIAVGLLPVKVNVVLLRGKNDGEVDDFIALTRENPIDVRFIELMPLGELGEDESLRIRNDELIAARPWLVPVAPRYPSQPSRDFQVDGYLGRVGFISPISHNFCGLCNRLRLMSDGNLRMCLGVDSEISLLPALQKGDVMLLEVIREAIHNKPARHQFDSDFISDKNMSRIGG
jgi:cyclic pyranopterin phosphate synthase